MELLGRGEGTGAAPIRVTSSIVGGPLMARRAGKGDDWDDDAVDSTYDDDDREEPTIPCPNCRRQIHEDSQRCPYCEHYVTEEGSPSPRKPWWIVIGVIVCLFVVYRWIAS